MATTLILGLFLTLSLLLGMAIGGLIINNLLTPKPWKPELPEAKAKAIGFIGKSDNS